MAKTVTTFSKTATGKIPYHFICNYCGMRNDKSAQISAEAREAYRGTFYSVPSGSTLDTRLDIKAMNELKTRIAQLEEQIRDYGCGMREGRTFRYSLLYSNLKGTHPDHIDKPLDGVCAFCGEKQAWAIDPTARIFSIVVLTMLPAFVLGFGSLYIVKSVDNDLVASLFGGFGMLSFIVGIVLMIVLPKRRIKKNHLMIAQEPNDLEKLPVLHKD